MRQALDLLPNFPIEGVQRPHKEACLGLPPIRDRATQMGIEHLTRVMNKDTERRFTVHAHVHRLLYHRPAENGCSPLPTFSRNVISPLYISEHGGPWGRSLTWAGLTFAGNEFLRRASLQNIIFFLRYCYPYVMPKLRKHNRICVYSGKYRI
jgi:hypothetical protein